MGTTIQRIGKLLDSTPADVSEMVREHWDEANSEGNVDMKKCDAKQIRVQFCGMQVVFRSWIFRSFFPRIYLKRGEGTSSTFDPLLDPSVTIVGILVNQIVGVLWLPIIGKKRFLQNPSLKIFQTCFFKD